MRSLALLFALIWLAGCQNVNHMPDAPVTVDTASDQELMDYYRGLHLVGVRLLSEDAGMGGRANLERFYELYFSENRSNALQYLRMSLFANPFNDDSKLVAAQLDSSDLFGLLNTPQNQHNTSLVRLGSGETLRQVSQRVYGTEHFAVTIDRYNSHFNPDFRTTGELLTPQRSHLAFLDRYVQPASSVTAPVRRVTAPETAPPVTQQETSIIDEPEPSVDERTVEFNTIEVLVPEEEVEVLPPPVTAMTLYQQGNRLAAYQLLRTQATSAQERRLYADLREQLVEAPYRKAVAHFHDQNVAEAIAGFRGVLSIEPNHQRAQQYLNRAIQLETRLRNID